MAPPCGVCFVARHGGACRHLSRGFLFPRHHLRQHGDDRGKAKQNGRGDKFHDDKPPRALKNGGQRRAAVYARDNEYVHAHRRGNQADFAHFHGQYAKPDRIKPQRNHRGKHDRQGDDQHGQRVQKHAQRHIGQQQQQHDQCGGCVAGNHPPGNLLRQLHQAQEEAENARAQHGEHDHGGCGNGAAKALCEPGMQRPGRAAHLPRTQQHAECGHGPYGCRFRGRDHAHR